MEPSGAFGSALINSEIRRPPPGGTGGFPAAPMCGKRNRSFAKKVAAVSYRFPCGSLGVHLPSRCVVFS